MQTKNLIKAIEKAGMKVEKMQRQIYDHFSGQYVLSSATYYAESHKSKISFHDQDGRAICCQIMGINEGNDSQSDYFPGYWARSIKHAIQGLI